LEKKEGGQEVKKRERYHLIRWCGGWDGDLWEGTRDPKKVEGSPSEQGPGGSREDRSEGGAGI